MRFQSLALSNLGWIALQRTSAAMARKHFLAALRLFRQLAGRMGIAEGLEGLAAVAAQEDGEYAAHLLGAAAALRNQISVPIPTENSPLVAETVARLGQSLPFDRLSACWADGGKRPWRKHWTICWSERAIA